MITSALEPLRIRRRGFVSRESLLMSACSFPTSPGKITLSLQWKTGRSATKMDSYTNTETKHPFNLLSSQRSLVLCHGVSLEPWIVEARDFTVDSIKFFIVDSKALFYQTIKQSEWLSIVSSKHQKVSYTLILLWSRRLSNTLKSVASVKNQPLLEVLLFCVLYSIFRRFGGGLQSRVFSAPLCSLSALVRDHHRTAASKPISWVSMHKDFLVHSDHTLGP